MKQNTRSLAQTEKLYYSWYLIMKSPASHSRFKYLLSGVHTSPVYSAISAFGLGAAAKLYLFIPFTTPQRAYCE